MDNKELMELGRIASRNARNPFKRVWISDIQTGIKIEMQYDKSKIIIIEE